MKNNNKRQRYELRTGLNPSEILKFPTIRSVIGSHFYQIQAYYHHGQLCFLWRLTRYGGVAIAGVVLTEAMFCGSSY